MLPMIGRPSRRAFIGTTLSTAAFFTTRGLFAEQLARTPSRTEGPFYPDKLPLDTDNDLIIVNDLLTPAVGEITHLTGRVLDATGSPIRNATVEIWQCDAKQVYIHTGDSASKAAQQDRNFQGSAASRPARRASTTSGRSNRCPIRVGRRLTFTSRSRRGATSS